MSSASVGAAAVPVARRLATPLHAIARADAPKHPAARCSVCAMRSLCLPPQLTAAEFGRLDSIICTTRHVRQGDALFRTDDPFQSIYAVRAGSFKTVMVHRDGREQVTGFQIAGETFGMDGISSGQHCCDAIALEDSVVCIIPFGQLEAACREMKPMQHFLYQMLSSEIVRESSQMLLLGTMSAEQRVAQFLLNLSSRFQARGYSASEFNLRMTREEIGCYLGMKLETVSRMFSRFHRDSLVETHGKRVRIIDAERLARV
ncbi:helix-turn-helix domain-containing protein [Burkholderia ubonensis]|uniref:helix-turn-helix domain-containing protein n=1 Tax=Burkholderia ubonensis TaxID=101571 RepID=UPI000759CF9F|nr:helix-turn-helix domain-containing protein [Burkholderia ubonensis]KVD68785.1 Crp/Fnr family transcriptional regulator [Burkholderia ubonensis]KVQ09837.1 Crp/Fnr family transcriptional regulator [Burkholderia ubonensis]KVW72096.1 Crp/Fnr family transcriptional regulator [Burkholderia ubonensis]KWK98257.1 Crp/Fnr family transcriptional regulator [Burkholderia ubonensis]KWK98808.1 Crp/Fnr family transcriptional regulator [Burkholderia ubonensis]